ncbi:MAG: restriction endonuclease subunit S, partial [Acetobacter sp.]|nr:restriction endonuclease subunit S [Acetobacter sp.]
MPVNQTCPENEENPANKAGWVKVKLGDVCEIYQPKTISKKEMCSNGAFPVFGANGKIGYYDRYNHEKP